MVSPFRISFCVYKNRASQETMRILTQIYGVRSCKSMKLLFCKIPFFSSLPREDPKHQHSSNLCFLHPEQQLWLEIPAIACISCSMIFWKIFCWRKPGITQGITDFVPSFASLTVEAIASILWLSFIINKSKNLTMVPYTPCWS